MKNRKPVLQRMHQFMMLPQKLTAGENAIKKTSLKKAALATERKLLSPAVLATMGVKGTFPPLLYTKSCIPESHSWVSVTF